MVSASEAQELTKKAQEKVLQDAIKIVNQRIEEQIEKGFYKVSINVHIPIEVICEIRDTLKDSGYKCDIYSDWLDISWEEERIYD